MSTPTRESQEQPRVGLTRRQLLGTGSGIAAGALLAPGMATASGYASLASLQAGDSIPEGGTLRVAIIGEPPVLADSQFTTATITSNIAQQIFEGLFARDSTYSAQPMLAESHTVSEDGLTYTFTIRQGISFHNGKLLTATDVVASLNRWGTLTGRGRTIFGRMNEIVETDPVTVTMTFNEPTGVLLDFLALIEAFIMPSEIAEAAGGEALTEEQLIGTGPFMFQERQIDQYIRFVRYDGYVPREEEPDGAAGRKVAYLDQIEFVPVPDASVRADGLITGEYQFADSVEPDQFDTLDGDPNVTPIIVKPYYWLATHFNKRQGLFMDERLRKAVSLAFSPDEAMISGFGREDFFRLDPAVAAQESAWYTDAGMEAYQAFDPEQAKALLAEAGYDGTPIRWLTTREYPYNFNAASLIAQRLEEVGMPVELVLSDWATLIQNRSDPTTYEVFMTGHSSYSHPATQPFNDPEWPGFWESEERDRILGEMIAEIDPEAQLERIVEYQELIWTEMPFVKCGDYFFLRAATANVQNYVNFPDWFFWNVGLSE